MSDRLKNPMDTFQPITSYLLGSFSNRQRNAQALEKEERKRQEREAKERKATIRTEERDAKTDAYRARSLELQEMLLGFARDQTNRDELNDARQGYEFDSMNSMVNMPSLSIGLEDTFGDDFNMFWD